MNGAFTTSDHPTESKQLDGRKPGNAVTVFKILTAGAAGMACLMALLPAAGHDQMWLLYAAGLMRHGAAIYGPQIFETNPPMILWLSAIPSAIAAWLHAADTAVGKLFVVGLEGGVAWACWRSMRIGWLRMGWLRARSSAGMAWAAAFVFVAVFAVMPARDFGQRDHLLVLLVLPYVFAAAAEAEGVRLPVWVGAAVGSAALAGIVMKPHQVLIAFAVEATLIGLLSRRAGRVVWGALRRPALLAMAASGGLFLAAVRLFAPKYFTQVVPLARDTYWAFGQLTFTQLVAEAPQLVVLSAGVLGWFVWSRRRRASALVAMLIAAGVAALAAYFLQGTGWYYQQLPALSLFALALCVLAAESTEERGWRMPPWAPWAAGGLTVLALALTTHFAGYPFTAARSFPVDTPDPSFFAGLPPGAAVTTLSTTVDYILPPVDKYHLTLGERYPLLVMLPAILRSERPEGGRLKRRLSPERIAELDTFQHRAMREDVARWHPQLLLVERCQDPAVHCQALGDRHDDLLGWFLRDPGFRAEFAGYRYWKSVGVFDAYVPR